MHIVCACLVKDEQSHTPAVFRRHNRGNDVEMMFLPFFTQDSCRFNFVIKRQRRTCIQAIGVVYKTLNFNSIFSLYSKRDATL